MFAAILIQSILFQSSITKDSQIQMFRAENLSMDLRKQKSSTVDMRNNNNDDEPYLRPMTSVAASRKLVEEKGLQFSDDEGNSSGTDYDEDDIYALKKTEGFKPVKGQPGMFYKVFSFVTYTNITCDQRPYYTLKKYSDKTRG